MDYRETKEFMDKSFKLTKKGNKFLIKYPSEVYETLVEERNNIMNYLYSIKNDYEKELERATCERAYSKKKAKLNSINRTIRIFNAFYGIKTEETKPKRVVKSKVKTYR